MAKRKHNQGKKSEPKDDKPTVGDYLKNDTLSKLKEMKMEWKEQEKRREAEEEQRKQEEKRQREKNKSFEDLLNESHLDWKKFK